MTEVAAALKAAQAELDYYRSVESIRLWEVAFQKDQEAARERGEGFWLGKTGPALEAFKHAQTITEASLVTKVEVLRWVLGKEAR
jgi:hypothetical protein